MSVLAIRLSADAGAGDPARWALLSDDGAVLRAGVARAPLSGLTEQAGAEGARIVLIVPGEDVTAHSVHLPAAGEAQTRAAARFAVEDDLAVDADGVHLAVAPGAAGAPRLVAGVAAAAMENWLAAAPAGVDIVAPEWACVPAAPGACGVLLDNGIAHANFGGWGFSADYDLAALLIPGALDRFDIRAVTVWGDPDAVAPSGSPGGSGGWGGPAVTAHPAPDAEAAMALLAAGARSSSVNLRQGPYAPRRRFAVDAGLWRRAAILLCALFASWLVLMMAAAAALDRRAAMLRADAEAVFAEAFPDEARIVNPRTQMQTRLSELRGREGGAFLDLAAALTAAVSAQPGVEISALRYDRASGALNAELLMPDYETLQALQIAAQAQGVALDEGASRQAAGRVAADVRVRLP